MGRLIRKTVILLKNEASYGVDAVPTGLANAQLVSNLNINPLNAQNVPRDLIRAYFGASEELVGTAFVEMGFDLELQGSGTAGTEPAWGAAMRSMGFAETVTADTMVEYTPVTDGLESCTIYWYDDGVLHKALGCFGSWDLNAAVGGRPVISCRFIGIDGGISAVANPAQTLTAWQPPQVVTNSNSGQLTLGCTYAAGALSGGTEYVSSGIELSSGNAVSFTPLLGAESVELTNREITGTVRYDLTAANEVSFMADVKANTLKSIGWLHGSAAGLKVLIFAPKVQHTTPSKQEINGKRLIGYNLRLLPDAGNDEFRIVAL